MPLKASWMALAGLACFASAPSAQAQDMQAKYEAKIAENWVSSGNWVLDFDKAKEQAKKEGKVIFAYFTRSYAP